MDDPKLCSTCGRKLEASAPGGLCPECLLQAGLGTGVDVGPETKSGGGPRSFVPPPVAQLAPLFPQLEILGLIGRGGMGAVYKASQKELDRVIALKILPPDIGRDAAFAERFTREARALAKLNHPGIVTIHDFGRADGLYFFLMEYVDGVTLRQLLHHGRISAREALAIVPQICDALQFAHDHGIVHCDIKPENILLDRRGRVKVADFGLAKIIAEAGAERTSAPAEAGKVMGTPSYMSPEQLQAPGEVDHRADIYALGLVFYQLLTGELPGKNIEPPSKKVQVDVRLDEVILRALEKKPELRYQQASDLKTEVETIMTTPPPASAPIEPPPANLPPKKSMKMVITAAITIVVLALTMIAWFTFKEPPAIISYPPGLVAAWTPGSGGYQNVRVSLVRGVISQAFEFAPNSFPPYTYVGLQIPDRPEFILTNALSIELWVRPRGDGYIIFCRGDRRPGLDPYSLSMEGNDQLRFNICNDQGTSASVKTTLPYGHWTHVAGTFDGVTGALCLYTNGQLAAQTTTAVRPIGELLASASPAIGIGNNGDGTDFPFIGDLDQIALYSRALTAAEIQNLYRLNAARAHETAKPLPLRGSGL